jgi:hypothetical protein
MMAGAYFIFSEIAAVEQGVEEKTILLVDIELRPAWQSG